MIRSANFLAAALTLALLILVGCDRTSSDVSQPETNPSPKAVRRFVPNPEALVKVVYAGSNWYGHAPAWVGVSKGIFREAGFEVELMPVGTSSDRVQLLATSSAQFASLGEVAMLLAMDAGQKGFYWLGNQNIAPGNEGLVARAGIRSIGDLKGRRVAVNMNSSVYLTLAMLLEDNGLSMKDITVVSAENDSGVLLFEKGEVDAACIWEPYYTRLRAVPGSVILATDENTSIYRRFKTMSGPDVVCASKAWVDEFPDRAKALMRAYFKAVQWCRDNPEALVELVAARVASPGADQEVAAALAKFQWLGWDRQPEAMDNLLNQSRVAARVMKDNGMITEVPKVLNWTFPEIYQD